MKELTREWIDQQDYKTLLTRFRQPPDIDKTDFSDSLLEGQIGVYFMTKMCEKKYQLTEEKWEKVNEEVKWKL